jgi:hypothetical protein
LPDVVARQVVINEDSFRAYKVGRDKPLPSTVEAVNKVLPGTLATWNFGPDGLPLWGVLDDDLTACHALVDDELANHTERPGWSLLSDKSYPIRNMSLLQKAQALLEITLPAKFWSRRYWNGISNPAAWKDDPDEENSSSILRMYKHIDRDIYHLTLEEFISNKPNVIAVSYAEGSSRLRVMKQAEQIDLVEPEEQAKIKLKASRVRFGMADYRNIISARRVLSLLALVKLLNSGSDVLSKDVADYVLKGIDQAILELFGTPVHEFVGDSF